MASVVGENIWKSCTLSVASAGVARAAGAAAGSVAAGIDSTFAAVESDIGSTSADFGVCEAQQFRLAWKCGHLTRCVVQHALASSY